MKTIAQEDLDQNPLLAALGAVVGDKVAISLSDEAQAAKDATEKPADTEAAG